MATISTNHSNLSGGYYTDNHHTDPTGVAASEVDAAKVDRFYIELDGTPDGGGQMIATGSMTFTDGGTIESNATVDAEMDSWGGGYSFDPSAGHLEIMTDDGLGDMSLTVGDVTTNTAGDAAAALDPSDVSLAYGYVQLVGLVFDGDEGAGTKSASVVGYYVPVSVNGVEHHLFFPTADQDLSNVSLPDGSGTRSTITHQDSLADGDTSSSGTFISYVDLLDADAVTTGGATSDLIVEGSSSGDLIDGTYTGDPDGDLVDNNDGNPNEVDGDNDSIVAGAGDDTVNAGAGNDTVLGGSGDDILNGNEGGDTLMGEGGDDQFVYTELSSGDCATGGETEETTGDKLDLTALNAGVSVTMTGAEAGTVIDQSYAEAGGTYADSLATSSAGAGGAGGTASSGGFDVDIAGNVSGGDVYLNDFVADPTNLYTQATDYVNSQAGGTPELGHVTMGGQDYVIVAGSRSVEFWEMDPADGTFTLAQTFDMNPDTTNTSLYAAYQNLHIVETTASDGSEKTFIYVDDYAGPSVFQFNDATGDFDRTQQTIYSDLASGDTPISRSGNFFEGGDGTLYHYIANNATSGVSRFEVDKDTGDILHDTQTDFKTFGYYAWGSHVVALPDGTAKFMVPDSSAGSKVRIYEMDADGNIDTTSYDTFNSGSSFDAMKVMEATDPFVDANGNIVIVGGRSTGDGGLYVIDPDTNTVITSWIDTKIEVDPIIAYDANGNMVVTSTHYYGQASTSRPYTVVIDSTDYSKISSGYDTDGGFEGNSKLGNGNFVGAFDNMLVTTTDGNNFLVQTNAQDGNTSTWLTSSSTELVGPGTATLTSPGDICFSEMEEIALTDFDDSLEGSDGNESVDGGAGNDTLVGNAGDDTLDGGEGDDSLDGGDDNDLLTGGAGEDTLLGGAGNDTLDGGDGADSLDGGLGDDDITVGGSDTALGGGGDDVFTIDPTVTDAGDITIVGGETDEEDAIDPTNNDAGQIGDVLDLTGLQDVVVTYDEADPAWDGTTSESGTVTYTNDDGQTVTINFSEIEHVEVDAPNYIVEGTDGGDLIDGTYTGDPDGDLVDNNDGNPNNPGAAGGDNDSIVAGAGDDTVLAGSGDDTVSGGDGNDLICGDDDAAATGGGATGGATGSSTFYGVAVTGEIRSIDDAIVIVEGANVIDEFEFTETSGNGALENGEIITANGKFYKVSYSTTQPYPVQYQFADGTRISGTPDNSAATGHNDITVTEVDASGTTVPGGEVFDVALMDAQAQTKFTTTEPNPNDPSSEIFYGTPYAGNWDDTYSLEELVDIHGPLTSVYVGKSGGNAWGPWGGGIGNYGTPTEGAPVTVPGDDVLYGDAGMDTLEGKAGDDYLDGGIDDDTVLGGDGSDTIALNDNFGNDMIEGGEDTDGLDVDVLDMSGLTSAVNLDLSANGAADPESGTVTVGTDVATFSEIEEVVATDLDDTITGSDGDDSIDMGAGADTIDAGEGDDSINLGDQDGDADVVTLTDGDGDDTLTGVDGPIDNGDGTFTGVDTLDVTGVTDPVTGEPVVTTDVTITTDPVLGTTLTFPDGTSVTFPELQAPSTDPTDPETESWLNALGIPSAAPNYIVEGTDGGDLIDANYTGDPEGDLVDANDNQTGTNDDSIVAGGGDDTIIAGEGDDTIDAGIGADSVDAGDGNDIITSPEGNNTIDGGSGNDTVSTGDGQDVVTGGTGDDSVSTGGGTDLIDGGDGSDTIDGGANSDTIDGGEGDDSLLGGGGTDSITGGLGNDTIDGGTSGDTIDGGEGADSLLGGGGDDSIDGGTGDDTIDGGANNDTVHAGEGDDVVDGGTGDDEIYGYEGSDTVDGGAGNDLINTRTSAGTGVPDIGYIHPTDPTNYSYPSDTDPDNDRDSVFGGAGDDTILTGDDADTIDGGDGADVIDAGFDADTVVGGTGNDSIQGGEGADTIDGGDDDDVIYGGISPLDPNYAVLTNAYDIPDVDGDTDTEHNSDYLMGGAGNDRIYGQDDSDTLEGGTGEDTLDGGIDDDVLDGGDDDDFLVGGQGNDVLTGGQGNDEFVFDNDGDDTITDFGEGITGDPNDGTDQTDNDFVDMSAYYEDLFDLRADFADDGILNQSNSIANGGTVDYSGYTEMTGSLDLTGAEKQDLTFDTTNVICFTRGTMIKTIDGQRAIEDLRQGDLVWTKDDGFQPIQWIGSKALDKATLEAAPNLRPVRIKAGAMGLGLPQRDLIVSPQHRVLVNSKIVQRMTKEDEVLVSAKHLLQLNGVDYLDADGVEYFHFLFDKHQIVLAEGAESESLFTGPEALSAVEPEARDEILEIFPELASMDYDASITAVRPILSGRQSRKLTVRHVQNRKALLM